MMIIIIKFKTSNTKMLVSSSNGRWVVADFVVSIKLGIDRGSIISHSFIIFHSFSYYYYQQSWIIGLIVVNHHQSVSSSNQ